MNPRNTIIAVATFAVLLVAVLLINPQTSSPATPTPTVGTPISGLKLEDVTSVTIQSKDGKRVAVQRDDNDNWKMTEPEVADANRNRIVTLLSQIIARPPQRRITDSPTNLAEYGLDFPEFSFDLGSAATTEGYLVGTTNPSESGVYVQKAGQSSIWLMSGLNTSLRDLVNRPPKAEPTVTPIAAPSPAPSGSPTSSASPAPGLPLGTPAPKQPAQSTPAPTATPPAPGS